MAQLTNPKKILTYGEYRQKLLEKYKANPNDPNPEVQKFKKELEHFQKAFTPSQEELKRVAGSVISATKSLTPVMPQIVAVADSFQPHLKAIESAYKNMLPVIQSIQAYTPPTYLIEAMERVVKDYRKLSLPMQVISQIFAAYETPVLYFKLPELRIIPIPNIAPKFLEPLSDFEQELIDDNKKLQDEIDRLKKDESKLQNRNFHYDYLRTTFVVWQPSIIALNFTSADGVMVLLFEVFFECLKERGIKENGVIKVFVSMSEAVKRAIAKGKREANNRWVTFNINNLRKKFRSQKAENTIMISDFDRQLEGYWFILDINSLMPFWSS